MIRMGGNGVGQVRRIALPLTATLVSALAIPTTNFLSPALGQDIPGIENCTAEKAMDRRTSCLQSNVNYLKAQITQLQTVSLGRIEAANRQIDALKASLITMQTMVTELKAAAEKQTPEAPKLEPQKSATPADTTKK